MNLAGKRIVTYSRYSSDNQRDASIEDQQRKACEYIAKNSGDPTLAVHFQDRAISASSLQRDGFEAMMTLVRARKVDVIITENTDRISRDLADSAIVFREVRYLEVPLIGVSNGFNSSAENAQIQFMLEAWKNEQYLKDLSYKTRRGLEGRALKGLSTGGIPIGYTSVPEHGPDGDVIGKKVILDEPRAELVRRIFRMYLEGLSLDRIAYKLNDEKVEPARRGKYKNKGWNAGTIREILRNEAYVGVWTYGKRRWVKVPGTNNRRYRPAPPEQVIRREYPERRIIDPQTWREVQARIATVRAYYAGTKDKPKGMAQSGKKASHILNGLLRCATCGSRMIVYGGSTTRYLRCSNNKKKGICKNNLSLRDDIARARILGAVRARYSSPEALTKIRQAVAERLRQLSSEVNAELKERRERLGRTNERIAALVAFLSDGNNSQAVRDSLRDLESQKMAETAAIEELISKATAPVRLPSPDELVAVPIDLEKAIDADPTRGREALARLFENGTITLEPQPGDFYIARSRFFPLGFAGGQGGAGSSSHGITPAQQIAVPREPWSKGRGFRVCGFFGACGVAATRTRQGPRQRPVSPGDRCVGAPMEKRPGTTARRQARRPNRAWRRQARVDRGARLRRVCPAEQATPASSTMRGSVVPVPVAPRAVPHPTSAEA